MNLNPLEFFKKKSKEESEVISNSADDSANSYNFGWHEIGAEGNPFNKRILDVRSLTWNVIATTKDKSIAESYNQLRSSFGKEYIDVHVENGCTSDVNLEYPHNGDPLEGIVFKADSMDIKWDIYIYDNIFYFTRSWTGELIYKAHVEIQSDKLVIHQIDYNHETDFSLAKSDVHFLIKAHAMGQVLPHQVPDYLETDMAIALYSFQQFGNKGCYACFEDITDTVISIKQ